MLQTEAELETVDASACKHDGDDYSEPGDEKEDDEVDLELKRSVRSLRLIGSEHGVSQELGAFGSASKAHWLQKYLTQQMSTSDFQNVHKLVLASEGVSA